MATGCDQLVDLQLLLERLQQLVTADEAQVQLSRLRLQLPQLCDRLRSAVAQLLDCGRRRSEVRDRADGRPRQTEEPHGREPLAEHQLQVR